MKSAVSNRPWVELGILGGGQLITIAGAVVATRVLTGLLPPAAYGDLALALTVVGCLNLVGYGAIGNAVGRFFAVARDEGVLRTFFRVVINLYVQYYLGACCLILVVLLLFYLSGNAGSGLFKLGLAAVTLSIIEGGCVLLDGMQNAARQRILVAWHQAAGQWMRLVAAVLFVRWLGATSANALWGYVTASGFVLGSQYLFFKIRLLPMAVGEPEVEKRRLRSLAGEMHGYASPFAAFGALAWIQQASDRWFLVLFASRAEVGLYQTLNQVGYSPLVQLSSLLSQVSAPILFSQSGAALDKDRLENARLRVRQLSALMIAATALVTGILWIWGPSIFALIVAPEYLVGVRYLPLMALAGGCFATGQILTIDALVQFKSQALIAPKIGVALIEVVLNYIGARNFGMLGIVWAGLISAGVYLLWMWFIASRGAVSWKPWKQPHDSGRLRKG